MLYEKFNWNLITRSMCEGNCIASATTNPSSCVLGLQSRFPIPNTLPLGEGVHPEHRPSNISQLSVNNKLLICFVCPFPIWFDSTRLSIQFDPMRYGLCWFLDVATWNCMPLFGFAHDWLIDWFIWMKQTRRVKTRLPLWLPYFAMGFECKLQMLR